MNVAPRSELRTWALVLVVVGALLGAAALFGPTGSRQCQSEGDGIYEQLGFHGSMV